MSTTTNTTTTSQPISIKNTTCFVRRPCCAALLAGGGTLPGGWDGSPCWWWRRGEVTALLWHRPFLRPFLCPDDLEGGALGAWAVPVVRGRRYEGRVSQTGARRCLMVSEDGNQFDNPRHSSRSNGPAR
jgi:hypothetical protein